MSLFRQIIYAFCRKAPDRLRQPLRKIGSLYQLRDFRLGQLRPVHDERFMLDHGHSMEAFDPYTSKLSRVLPRHIKERSVNPGAQVGVFEVDVSRFNGERRAVLAMSSLRIVPDPKHETYSAVAWVSAHTGPTQCVAYHMGGNPGQ